MIKILLMCFFLIFNNVMPKEVINKLSENKEKVETSENAEEKSEKNEEITNQTITESEYQENDIEGMKQTEGLLEVFQKKSFKDWAKDFLSTESFSDTQLSFSILDSEGKSVISINPDLKLNQASVSKVIITIAALKYLTLGYKFKTKFYLTSDIDDTGNLKGNLIVKGLGDVNLTTEDLDRIIDYFKFMGLKKITGDLILDVSYFDSEYNIYTLFEEDDSKAYAPLNSALPLNQNSISFSVKPGKKEGEKANILILSPFEEVINIKNNLKTTKKQTYYRIKTSKDKNGKTLLTVDGQINLKREPTVHYRKIHNPDDFFGKVFLKLLDNADIKISGKLKISKKDTLNDKKKPKHFYTYYTKDLFDVLVLMNRYSTNFIAEQLLKIVGSYNNNQATWKNGIENVKKMLKEDIGIEEDSYQYQNASGMNDADFFTSAQIAKILNYAYTNFDYKWYILSTLPKIGISGTLKNYCINGGCDGALVGKTGSLRTTVALAGFIKGKKDIFSFSFAINFEPSKKKFRKMLLESKAFINEILKMGEL